MRLPVASQTASASAIRERRPRSHRATRHRWASATRSTGSWSSAPTVTGEPDLPDQDRALAILVPQRDGGPLGHQAELEPFARGDVGAGKGAHRLPQRRRRGGRPVGDQQGKALQQQVKRAGGCSGGGRAWAARQTSSMWSAPARCPANVAAIHAVR